MADEQTTAPKRRGRPAGSTNKKKGKRGRPPATKGKRKAKGGNIQITEVGEILIIDLGNKDFKKIVFTGAKSKITTEQV